MKNKNRDNRSGRRAIAFLAALAVVTAIAIAVVLAFNKLRDLWIEQCEIRDVNTQVTVEMQNSANSGSILEKFGLRNGANLATIDFAARRDKVLKEMPNLKSINITRKLPDKVALTVIEREPLARIGISGVKRETGRVCDDEGVVYKLRRGSEMLPVIRESGDSGTAVGKRLDGRPRAALALLLVAREAQFSDLNILEIDAAKPDFLLITLADYSAIKFRWEGMDSPTPESDAALRAQLTCVTSAIGANLSGSTRIWNATRTGVITADSNRPN